MPETPRVAKPLPRVATTGPEAPEAITSGFVRTHTPGPAPVGLLAEDVRRVDRDERPLPVCDDCGATGGLVHVGDGIYRCTGCF